MEIYAKILVIQPAMVKRMSRPKGARNAKPSREAIQSYYRLLTSAADKGDVNAAGWLVSIATQQRQPSDLNRERTD